MIAETATLLVRMIGEGNLASVAAKNEQSLGRLNATARTGVGSMTVLGRASSSVSKSITGLGGALGHASGKIGGLLTGPLGLIGLTGGVLSLGGAITTSIRKVQDFGLGLEKIQGLTGETALSAGTLIQLFDKYGLGVDRVSQIAGFAEKTLGKLNATTAGNAKAAKSAELQNLELVKAQRQAAGQSTTAINKLISEQKGRDAVTAAQQKAGASVTKLALLDKTYGLQLLDTRGKVVSFSQVLEQLAALYDRKNVPASTKAYVASQVLGRGYAALIPILTNGSAAIAEASKETRALGLDNAGTAEEMVKFRDVMRNLGEQVDIVQMRIGLALVPAITDAAKAISSWLDNGGDQQIIDFFKSGAKFAQAMGHAIETTIVPAFKAIAAGWSAIPGPLKDLLIGTFVANKAGKFLFDKSLLQGGKNILGSLLGKIPVVGGAAAQLTGTGGTPVFVTNWPAGFGGPGGLNPANLVPAAAGLPVALAAATFTAIVASPLYLSWFAKTFNPTNAKGSPFGQTFDPSLNARQQGAIQATGSRTPNFGDARLPGGGPNITSAILASSVINAATGFNMGQRGVTGAGLSGAGITPLVNAQTGFVLNMRHGVDAFAEAVAAFGKIVHSGVFKKAQAVREAGGFALSRDAVISMLHGKGPLGTDALVSGQAIALAQINHLRMDKNPDLKSAANNLALLKRLQDHLPANLASQLAPKIHSLEVAINRVTAAVKAKQFVVNVNAYTGANQKPGIHHAAGTGPLQAEGWLGMLSSPTQLGIAGEAGREAVAIIRNPRPIHASSQPMVIHNNIRVSSSIRDTNTAQDKRIRWGKTPTQVGAM